MRAKHANQRNGLTAKLIAIQVDDKKNSKIDLVRLGVSAKPQRNDERNFRVCVRVCVMCNDAIVFHTGFNSRVVNVFDVVKLSIRRRTLVIIIIIIIE